MKHFVIMDIMVGFAIRDQKIFKLIKKKEMDLKLDKLLLLLLIYQKDSSNGMYKIG